MNFLKLENCDLYYQETGSGDPVVLIHGMGSDHTAWGGLVPLLQTNYRHWQWIYGATDTPAKLPVPTPWISLPLIY